MISFWPLLVALYGITHYSPIPRKSKLDNSKHYAIKIDVGPKGMDCCYFIMRSYLSNHLISAGETFDLSSTVGLPVYSYFAPIDTASFSIARFAATSRPVCADSTRQSKSTTVLFTST